MQIQAIDFFFEDQTGGLGRRLEHIQKNGCHTPGTGACVALILPVIPSPFPCNLPLSGTADRNISDLCPC
jgi:hypothetical protein